MCKEADQLTIVCIEVVTGDADMTQLKQDFSDLITSASENIRNVTISSVLPDATGTRDERIKGITNFLKDKCRDTGARRQRPAFLIPRWILRHVSLPKWQCPSFYLRDEKVNE